MPLQILVFRNWFKWSGVVPSSQEFLNSPGDSNTCQPEHSWCKRTAEGCGPLQESRAGKQRDISFFFLFLEKKKKKNKLMNKNNPGVPQSSDSDEALLATHGLLRASSWAFPRKVLRARGPAASPADSSPVTKAKLVTTLHRKGGLEIWPPPPSFPF